jgi:hypothetical protein
LPHTVTTQKISTGKLRAAFVGYHFLWQRMILITDQWQLCARPFKRRHLMKFPAIVRKISLQPDRSISQWTKVGVLHDKNSVLTKPHF